MKNIPRQIWLARLAWVFVGMAYGAFGLAFEGMSLVHAFMAIVVGVAVMLIPTRTE